MTDAELYALIQSDPTAKAHADAGRDADCAARCRAIAPPVLTGNQATERSLYDAFADPADAEAILQGLATIGQSNPVVARAASWLKPDQGGLDVGHATVRTMLDQLAAAAPNVFTAARVAAIKALGETAARISADDVSRAMLPHRPNGKVSN